MDYELELAFTDRYKRTRFYTRRGAAFFGIWNPPEILLDGDEEEIEVQEGEEGQLELFALRVYGEQDGKELWWAIAQVNKIDFPFEQVVPGLQLIIPKPAVVRAALNETITRQTQGNI